MHGNAGFSLFRHAEMKHGNVVSEYALIPDGSVVDLFCQRLPK